MGEWLPQIIEDIADGNILPAAYFRSLDCDAALDARDGDDVFVSDWERVFTEINRRWRECNIADHERQLADDIRRESFMAISRATQQHEIASYVSDDFDLIVRGRLVGLADPLLIHLWNVYHRGEFPRPPML